MINARMFNRQIGVERPYKGDQASTLAQMYGPQANWQSIGGLIWASVEAVSGSEQVKGSGVQATTLYRIRTRYRPDITTRCRVLLPDPRGELSGLPSIGNTMYGRTLSIISVTDDDGGRRQVLEIMAKDNANA